MQRNETTLKNNTDTLTSYIETGLSQKFKMIFGFPLLFVESPNRKEVAAKSRQEQQYPFGFASVSTIAVNRSSYNAKSLLRRGLKSQSNTDYTNTYSLNLIPTKTVYSVACLFQSRQEVQRFANQWLIASIAKSLNFSITYAVADIDIHCMLTDSLSMPKPDIGIADTREFELTAEIEVDGYANTDLKLEQAATSVEVEGVIKDLGQTHLEALQLRPDSQVFLFKNG
jgi:hypothetical protein